MKRWMMVVLFCILPVGLLITMVGVSGCVNPPTGTVYIDTNGDGQPDALAWDRNGDGQPDAIPGTTQPAIVPGSQHYATAEKIDSGAPVALGGLAGILTMCGLGGVGAVVGAVGAAWKGSKFARAVTNLVMSIQVARQATKDAGGLPALAVVDDALRQVQDPSTIALVTAVKEKLQLIPVAPPDVPNAAQAATVGSNV
jgi:hypothetical protein